MTEHDAKPSWSLLPEGQSTAWIRLLKLANKLPQSLILVGPPGVGKKRAAKALFQWLHCQAPKPNAPCGLCKTCSRIAEDRHPDLIEVIPSGEQILVEDLREVKKMLFFPPLEGKKRFILIDDAHKLNLFSANSLLKTLEEPPSHTRFFLITHERGLLLPTLISRSQFIHFAPLDLEVLERLMHKMQIHIPEKLLPWCMPLFAGGVARARLFSDDKVIAFIEAIETVIARKNPKASESNLADQLGPEEWKIELFLDLFVLHHQRMAELAAQTRSLHSASFHASQALKGSALRHRLGRYANKKLIAFAAAHIAQQSSHAMVETAS